MLFCEYKNTIKTLLRSWTFWISLAVLVFIVIVDRPIVSFAEGHKPESLSVVLYNQQVNNYIYSAFLIYALPIFTVITTVVVLNQDYGNQFFEIEKAADIKPFSYLSGRILAIVSVQLIVLLLISGGMTHFYVLSWGGVEGMSFGVYLLDSTFRLLYNTFGGALPCILFFVGLTYMVGTLSKSGIVAAGVGLGYTALFDVLLMFKLMLIRVHQSKAAEIFFNYLCHVPDKLKKFLFFWNIDGGWETMQMYPHSTSLGKAALSFAILIGFFVLFTAVSYLRIRKRES